MNLEDIGGGGCSPSLLWFGVIVGLVALAIVLGLPVLKTVMDEAAADREQARAEVIRAETDQAHQDSLDWERRFMLWTVALQTGGTDAAFGLLAALMAPTLCGAMVLGWWIGGRLTARR